MQPKLLLAEDDSALRGVLSRGLGEEGFDVLAVATGRELLEYAPRQQPDVLVVDPPELVRRQTAPMGRRGRLASAVLAAMVVLLLAGVTPVVAGLLAAGAMVLLRVLTMPQAYRAVSWTTVVLVGGMISLSTAMQQSGAAEQMAKVLVDTVGGASPYLLVLGLCLLTAVLGGDTTGLSLVLATRRGGQIDSVSVPPDVTRWTPVDTGNSADLIVAVVNASMRKDKGLLTAEERVEFIESATSHLPNVRVETFGILIVDYARSVGAKAIVKGLRAISDFEYELEMNQLNRHLAADVESVYLMASPQYSFLSSSGVKEIATFGGDISSLVPEQVAARLQEAIAR